MRKKNKKTRRFFKKDRLDLKFEIAKITLVLVLIILFPWFYLCFVCLLFIFIILYLYFRIFKIITLYNSYVYLYIYYFCCYLTYHIFFILKNKNIYPVNIKTINIFIKIKIPFFGYDDFGPKIPNYDNFINDTSLSRRKRKYYSRYLQRRIRLRFLHVYNFKTMNRRNKKPKLYLFRKRAGFFVRSIFKLIIILLILLVLTFKLML